MSRQRPRYTKQDVLRVFNANPTLTSYQIAAELGPDCEDAYVRATLKRNGFALAKSKGPHDWELPGYAE